MSMIDIPHTAEKLAPTSFGFSHMRALSQIYDEAVFHHRAGDLAKAAWFCDRLIAAEPMSFHGNYLLSIIRLQQRRHEDALNAVRIALKADQLAVDALVIQGLAYQALLRFPAALASFDRALEIRPDFVNGWWRRAMLLDHMGDESEALFAYGQLLQLCPLHGGGLKARADLLLRLGRFSDARMAYDEAISAVHDDAELHNGRGLALAGLREFGAAIESFSLAVAISPTAESLNNRGKALLSIDRNEEALTDFERATTLDPRFAQAWMNLGIVLSRLQRSPEAIDAHTAALSIDPQSADAFHNRANVRRGLRQFAEAESDYRRALALQPDHSQASYNLGAMLCEQARVEEGFAVFHRWAIRLSERGDFHQATPARQWHDREQQQYRSEAGMALIDPGKLHLEAGTRLAGPAINIQGAEIHADRWHATNPKILVMDDFLTTDALTALREFCCGSTIWRKTYDNYLGAFPEHGFCCPLLAQIADELPRSLPGVFRDYPLLYLWAFKYGAGDHGTKIHADFAAVNVNFWITPDSANLGTESGGLKIWPVTAPGDWSFSRYNGSADEIRALLAQRSAQPVKVPYRANRAVIFDSDLFHETDRIHFKDNYVDRRINITLLYGRRHEAN